MRCPYCDTAINLVTDETSAWPKEETGMIRTGYDLSYGHCPECHNLIVLLRYGNLGRQNNYLFLSDIIKSEIIYPKYVTRNVAPEVPERYKKDFQEACAVLVLSPKASAAISRRILQDLLHEQYNIKERNLNIEIEKFINLKDIPSFLTEAVDAVRVVGNFAAHPLKNTNTGEIIDIEPGEADWLLDVLEALFDFTFIQPNKLKEKKQNLNQKLQSLGKPPMKGTVTFSNEEID
jgi:hypothetical protein